MKYFSKWFNGEMEATPLYIVEGVSSGYEENISHCTAPRPKLNASRKVYLSFGDPILLEQPNLAMMDYELAVEFIKTCAALGSNYLIGMGTLGNKWSYPNSSLGKVRKLFRNPRLKEFLGRSYTSVFELESQYHYASLLIECLREADTKFDEMTLKRRYGLEIDCFDELFVFSRRELMIYCRTESVFRDIGNYGAIDWYFSDSRVFECDIASVIYDRALSSLEKKLSEIGREFRRLSVGAPPP